MNAQNLMREKTTDMKTDKFIIMAHRSGMSVLGAATRPLKNAQNEVMTFETRDQARNHKNQITAELKTPNVHYTVQKLSEL
jgi:hypothetical protein